MKAALFDLDGVIFDTEGQYSDLWRELGKEFRPDIANFEQIVKGHTLKEIFQDYIASPTDRQEISKRLNSFEKQMSFQYIPGALEFIEEIRKNGVKTAVVTSSNNEKMENVYRKWDGFISRFDAIVTAEKIKNSKPDPECYLLAAKLLDVPVSQCVVFEDSFAGLEAGKRAEMKVVGLATTNPEEAIAPLSDIVISDFRTFTYQDFLNI